jgi:hypothetical protein
LLLCCLGGDSVAHVPLLLLAFCSWVLLLHCCFGGDSVASVSLLQHTFCSCVLLLLCCFGGDCIERVSLLLLTFCSWVLLLLCGFGGDCIASVPLLLQVKSFLGSKMSFRWIYIVDMFYSQLIHFSTWSNMHHHSNCMMKQVPGYPGTGVTIDFGFTFNFNCVHQY